MTETGGLSRNQFLKKYAEPSLVFSPLALKASPLKVDTDAPVKLRKTKLVSYARLLQKEGAENLASGFILPVKKSGRNPFTPVSVGRAGNNDIVLPDSTVSKFHAHFLVFHESWRLTDQRSTNGTWVNDTELRPEKITEIRNGDKVSFGRTVSARFFSAEGLWNFVLLCRKVKKIA